MPGPGEPKTRTCISLRSDQLDALKGVSRETGAPVAELTRRAVDAYLIGRAAGCIRAASSRARAVRGRIATPTSRS